MNTSFEVKALTLRSIISVYRTHLKADFISEERKPLLIILGRYLRKKYFCYGLYEQNQLMAYAFFVMEPTIECLLLDYYAVCKAFRGKGYGTVFLTILKQMLPSYKGIVAEAESAATATSEQEATIRKRRIAFYKNLGFERTGTSCTLYHVDYDILFLPLAENTTAQWGVSQLELLYKAQLNSSLVDKYVFFHPSAL